MKLNPATRTRILADLTLDIDPDGSTVEVKVADTWFPAEWLTAATTATVTVDGVTALHWFRTARTTGHFCGPDATAAGATLLTRGQYETKTRVTIDGDQLVADADLIDVRY